MSPEFLLISPDPILTDSMRRVAGEFRIPFEAFPSLAAARSRIDSRAAVPRVVLLDEPAPQLAAAQHGFEQTGAPAWVFCLTGRAAEVGLPTDGSGGGIQHGETFLRRPETENDIGPLLTHVLGETATWVSGGEAGVGMDALVGRSVAFRTVLDQAMRAASGDGPVLLTGEHGVGKQLFAHAIHTESLRALRGFAAWRCPGLPSGELGRELRAPRSAGRGTPSETQALQPVEGGTLYLDDVTTLSAEVQAELLAYLDAWELARAQGLRGTVADVRIIAGTRTPLADLVARGFFRADLAERLGACTIRIPPLRERPSDILLLAEHFLGECARRAGVPVPRLADATKQVLASYRWPGNIRELSGVLQVAMQRAEGATEISVTHLPQSVQAPERSHEAIGPSESANAAGPLARIGCSGGGAPQRYTEGQVVIELPEEGVAFDDLERAILRAALERTRGNVVRAARLLRLGRGSLRYRLEKHGIMQPKRRRAARRRVVKEPGALAESLSRAS